MDNSLIDAVYRKSPLWNSAHELHGHSAILKKLWEEIAEELQKDVKTIKTRWKNLRAYYIKERQKIETSKGALCSTWQYFEKMQFIKYNTQGSNKIDDNYDDCNYETSTVDELHTAIEPSSPAQSSTSDPNSFGPQRKRTTADVSNAQENEELLYYKRRKIELLENEAARKSNDDLLFFESLLPYMEIIPPLYKLRLRSKIQDLIFKEVENVQNGDKQYDENTSVMKADPDLDN